MKKGLCLQGTTGSVKSLLRTRLVMSALIETWEIISAQMNEMQLGLEKGDGFVKGGRKRVTDRSLSSYRMKMEDSILSVTLKELLNPFKYLPSAQVCRTEQQRTGKSFSCGGGGQ